MSVERSLLLIYPIFSMFPGGFSSPKVFVSVSGEVRFLSSVLEAPSFSTLFIEPCILHNAGGNLMNLRSARYRSLSFCPTKGYVMVCCAEVYLNSGICLGAIESA